MPLLLLDLDNTLVDRAAALRRWAGEYVDALGAPPEDVEWLIAADRDGFENREVLAAAIREHFGLDPTGQAEVLEILRGGLVENLVLDPAVPEKLVAARAAGWIPVAVTNGTVQQQERKLRHTGLDRYLSGWVISEGAGIRKPDARIFQLAAERVGQATDGAWMIGDSAAADIGGAHNAGLCSIWLHRGRPWPDLDFTPTALAGSVAEAIATVIA
ncbi:MAG TPA: HAD family hydrolase [Mycobacteriales bacterium]|nr:HAD family hydrolase [Mycobacteriales bacterium]